MASWIFSKQWMTRWVLCAIVLGSCTLSMRWVFLVPIFESPDEDTHYDYALCLSELGKLIRANHKITGDWPSWVVAPYIHPHVGFLTKETDKHSVACHPDRHVPADYGSRDYFKRLNQNAPRDYDLEDMPYTPALAAIYPYGYYTVLAAWIRVVRIIIHDKPVAIFFAARIFSVLLLACSLILSYAIARELRLRRDLAFLLTACVGFFPLTSFVSSYVQPDNLAWTLVSLCFYLGLLLRRRPEGLWLQAVLGLALGCLLVTKAHFCACVSLPILAMLAVELYRPNVKCLVRYVILGLFVAVPALVLESIHLWVVSGSTSCYTEPVRYTSFNEFVLGGFTNAVWDYFVWNTHLSFWGIFGWMDTHIYIRDLKWTQRVRFVQQVSAWLFLVLTLVRLEQVASRLIRLARKGRRRLALRMALSNVPLNSYFLFTVFMLGLYVYYQNRFGAQGRNWVPYLFPTFLTSAIYAPKALTMRKARLACTWAVILGLLLYCAFGGYYSIKIIKLRYYVDQSTGAASFVLAK
jgi:hypothetical protein